MFEGGLSFRESRRLSIGKAMDHLAVDEPKVWAVDC